MLEWQAIGAVCYGGTLFLRGGRAAVRGDGGGWRQRLGQAGGGVASGMIGLQAIGAVCCGGTLPRRVPGRVRGGPLRAAAARDSPCTALSACG